MKEKYSIYLSFVYLHIFIALELIAVKFPFGLLQNFHHNINYPKDIVIT